MINRRSVPALHRACLHQRYQPEIKNPDENFRAGLLKTDMTACCRDDRPQCRAAPQKQTPVSDRARTNETAS
jgi:hypothetical protein